MHIKWRFSMQMLLKLKFFFGTVLSRHLYSILTRKLKQRFPIPTFSIIYVPLNMLFKLCAHK